MKFTATEISVVSLIITGFLAFCGFMNLLRSKSTLIILLVFTFSIAIFGMLIRNETTKMVNGNTADMLLSPLIYILTFTILRYFFKRKFNVEPTYKRHTWNDYDAGRRQNWFEVLVFALPLFLSLILRFILERVLDKIFLG